MLPLLGTLDPDLAEDPEAPGTEKNDLKEEFLFEAICEDFCGNTGLPTPRARPVYMKAQEVPSSM